MKARLLVVAAVAGIAITLAPRIAQAAAYDQARTLCLQNDTGRTIETSFTLDRGRDYRLHIPNMGLAPELENDQPAYVFFFAGSVDLPLWLAAPPRAPGGASGGGVTPTSFTGVVCIVQAGVPNFYTNVDSTGTTP